MITRVYQPRRLFVHCDGSRLPAYTFVVNRRHPQYAAGLGMAETAALIRQGVGVSGSCAEYLANTVEHLDELGFADGPLHRLLDMVGDGQP